MEISDLVNELIIRKTKIVPSKEDYLQYCFEYTCQLMERMGMKPGEHPNTLRLTMKSYIQRDVDFIDEYYVKFGRPHRMKVPRLTEIPEHINHTLLKYHKEIKKK